MAAGAAGCVPAGLVAAVHFGEMHTPYFGGTEILAAALGTMVVAALGFVRAAAPTDGWTRWLAPALAPLPLAALLLLPLHALPFTPVSLELDSLRSLARDVGLGAVGALVGGALGAAGGLWIALSQSLARAEIAHPANR
jgi:hypothetical protein